MAHDIFISHSSQDKAVADAACAKLEARNVRCWMAPRDILPGMDWGEAIIDAIGGAKVMVLIFSNDSNTSPQVKREVQIAVGEGVAILPFRIEDVTPIKSLRYYLGTQHWLDALTPPLEQHLERLSDAVSALLAKMPDTPPGTEPGVRPHPQPIEASSPAVEVARQETSASAGGSLAERLKRLRESGEQQRAEAEEAEVAKRQRREEEFAALQGVLVEQLDTEAFEDARATVTAMLRLRPDDTETREAQALILQQLGGVVGGEEAVAIPGTDLIIDMAVIPPGTFMMGSTPSEPGRNPRERQHEVTITKGFWLGKYAVTQAQWQAVMGNNPSKFKGDDQRPVELVSWDNCQQFLQKLNALGGGEFRLPTEAEWEYACRAGSSTAFCFGDNQAQLDDYAWYSKNSGGQTHPVGQKTPNAWGLYDMHGNVWEWCEDWHGEYPSEAPRTRREQLRAATGCSAVVRGSSIHIPVVRRIASTTRRTIGPTPLGFESCGPGSPIHCSPPTLCTV